MKTELNIRLSYMDATIRVSIVDIFVEHDSKMCVLCFEKNGVREYQRLNINGSFDKIQSQLSRLRFGNEFLCARHKPLTVLGSDVLTSELVNMIRKRLAEVESFLRGRNSRECVAVVKPVCSHCGSTSGEMLYNRGADLWVCKGCMQGAWDAIDHPPTMSKMARVNELYKKASAPPSESKKEFNCFGNALTKKPENKQLKGGDS